MADDTESLLLVTHVGLKRDGDRVLIDDQTALGLRQWCRHFSSVTYYGIEADTGSDQSSVQWVDVASEPWGKQCDLRILPRAYSPRQMARHHQAVTALLAEAVRRHRYLCFTIGGLFGDWPAVAAQEAIRQKRPYAAWFDRVEPAIIRMSLPGASLKRRLWAGLTLPIMERYHRHLLKRSAVALLQGGDTFAHYGRWQPNSHVIYDTHTTTDDQIGPAQLDFKLDRLRSGQPLRIAYAGRAAEMKGPDDWLTILEGLKQRNVPFSAQWLGDGPELERMRTRVANGPLDRIVALPGYQARSEVLATLRDSDLVLYCHQTPESPRSLIEALVCGCPLAGYDSQYVRELTRVRGGGAYAPLGNTEDLVQILANLHENRDALARLVTDAASSGALYSEDAVYADRAALMKQAGSNPAVTAK